MRLQDLRRFRRQFAREKAGLEVQFGHVMELKPFR